MKNYNYQKYTFNKKWIKNNVSGFAIKLFFAILVKRVKIYRITSDGAG